MSVQADEVIKPSFWLSVKAVVWSFVGLRSRKAFDQDTQRINPLHVVLVGLMGVFVFVAGLMALVSWVVPS
jgi:hypothetical protein